MDRGYLVKVAAAVRSARVSVAVWGSARRIGPAIAVTAIVVGWSLVLAACAPEEPAARPATTPPPPPITPSSTAAAATFAEVERPPAPTPPNTEPGPTLELCGVPIADIPANTGPRVEAGTAGDLRPANTPDGVRLATGEVILSDGASLTDFRIAGDMMIRIETRASVVIERVAADNAWIFMEEGASLTMRDSDIARELTADNWYVLDGHGDGGLLEYNRFHGGEAATIFLRTESSNWIIRNNDVSGGEDGFKPGGSGHLIEANWIHDLATGTKLSSGEARHADGLQLQGGNIGLSIRCNFIDSSVDGANAAIIIKPDLGDIAAVTVSENAMAGGAYTLYSIVAGTDHPMTDVTIGDNIFFAGTGFYGPAAIDNDVTAFTDNVTENAEPVTAD